MTIKSMWISEMDSWTIGAFTRNFPKALMDFTHTHIYSCREQVIKKHVESGKRHYSAGYRFVALLNFQIRWNPRDARWEHKVERLLIEEDLTQSPEQWGVIEESLYAVNETGHEGNPVDGEWRRYFEKEPRQDQGCKCLPLWTCPFTYVCQ